MCYAKKIIFLGILLLLTACATQSGLGTQSHANNKATVCPSKGVSESSAPTVFGLPLGAQLSIPECDKKSYGYSIGTSKTCFERLSDKKTETSPVCNETVSIRFPTTKSPNIVKGSSLLALIIGGRLEGIGFNTYGYSSQDRDLAILVEKFGNPGLKVPQTVSNRLGAHFETFSADWSKPNVQITFEPVAGNLDSGLVNIDTTEGSEYRKKKLQELTKDPNPL